MRNKHKTYLQIFAWTLLCWSCFTMEAWARAGGGGGSESGGGGGGEGGDGLGFLIYLIFRLIPFPFNIVVLGLGIAGYVWYQKKQKTHTILQGIQTPSTSLTQGIQLVQSIPGFDTTSFLDHVKSAFISIQQAWSTQNLAPVRHFISDGVYQRFHTQFIMMQKLQQTNQLSNVKVHHAFIHSLSHEGPFDCIHVGIHASLTDRFESATYTNLNEGGSEEFVEYWTFIRKKGVQNLSLFNNPNCPNCGAALPEKAGEVARCTQCSSILNTGDYDWVLSEITQADDFQLRTRTRANHDDLEGIIQRYFPDANDITTQVLEDKASNGYLQIMTALVTKNAASTRRFVSDSVFESLQARIQNEIPFVFNRLYINDVTTIDAYIQDGMNHAVISVKATSQKVLIKDGKAVKADLHKVVRSEILVLSRKQGAKHPKASIFAHNCPNCGGAIGDTVDVVCPYCGSTINSPDYEWIITEFMPASAYPDFKAKHGHQLLKGTEMQEVDEMEVRDFAFQNMLIVLACDGQFNEQERGFAQNMAKKWGYNPAQLNGLFELAMQQKIPLRMPTTPQQRAQVIQLMEQAAAADHVVKPEEKQILERVKHL